MNKLLNYIVNSACLILLTTSTAMAADITLAWNENPEQDIAGYKVYYQADSATLPFEGFEAAEGNSPIDIGNATTITLSGLPEGKVFYFTVNAYNTTGGESAFSDIVASDWVPELIAPDDGAFDESTTARFIWGMAPPGYDVSYTLYYGTDPELLAANLSLPGVPGSSTKPLTIIFILGFSGLIVFLGRTTGKTIAVGAFMLIMSFAMSGCGGETTGLVGEYIPGNGTTNNSTTPLLPDVLSTRIVFKDSDNYHEAFDLEPATVYYWKVVAVDRFNANIRHESQKYSFTTAAN